MICPWCNEEVTIRNGRCPKCRNELYEVSDEDFNENAEENQGIVDDTGLSIAETIEQHFKCSKCGGHQCSVKEVAMTGTGLSKLFDIQHNHYLFVSCLRCGFVEVYDPDILSRQKSGKLGSIMDILFG